MQGTHRSVRFSTDGSWILIQLIHKLQLVPSPMQLILITPAQVVTAGFQLNYVQWHLNFEDAVSPSGERVDFLFGQVQGLRSRNPAGRARGTKPTDAKLDWWIRWTEQRHPMAAAGETSGAPQIETCHKVELSLTIATSLHPVHAQRKIWLKDGIICTRKTSNIRQGVWQ